MSNYIEYKEKAAFHPGYYIKEIVDDSGLTQEDFAKRLGTTPKNLSLLIRGEQSISIDIAMKLSRLLGTSIAYWLNLQKAYDALIAEFKSEEELAEERIIFNNIEYVKLFPVFNASMAVFVYYPHLIHMYSTLNPHKIAELSTLVLYFLSEKKGR